MDRDPFKLDDLPRHSAPSGLWEAIDRRLDSAAPARHRLHAWRAAAAVALAAVGLAAVLQIAPAPDPVPGQPAGPDARLSNARATSMLLERALASERRSILDARSAAEVAWIESELRLTDELLSERPRDTDLWVKRTELLGEMAQRYDAGDWQAQVRLASY